MIVNHGYIMKIIKKYILSFFICVGLLATIIWYNPSDIGAKITIIALIGTALIYSFQLNAMNEQKDISEKSFSNQEKILEEQKNIANKQYEFDIFKMRLKLRNELSRAFFELLVMNKINSNNNYSMLDLNKLFDDIPFVFTKNIELDNKISEFHTYCMINAELLDDREVLTECRKNPENKSLIYKDLIEVYPKALNKLPDRNYTKFKESKMSENDFTNIFGILEKYVDRGNTKMEIDLYWLSVAEPVRQNSKALLMEILSILDKDIQLKS